MRVIGIRICSLAWIPLAVVCQAKVQNKTNTLKSGIRTPGIQIPMASLKPEAEIALPGPVDALFVGDSIFVANKATDKIIPVGAKTGKTEDPISGIKQPCAAMISAFKSIWVPSCADGTLSRLDEKTKKITASVPVPVIDSPRSVSATADSVWVLSDSKTTLTRIDPDENRIVAEIRLPASCNSIIAAESALWVSCPNEDKVLRIDPATNLVANRIEVSPHPVSLTFGESSIWALCKTEGKVARIDPKTYKVTTNIDLNTPGLPGEIAFGEGFVWISSNSFPVTRIDPANDKVAQQFAGQGGGSLYVGAGSVWLPNLKANTLLRFDPKRIKATLAD